MKIFYSLLRKSMIKRMQKKGWKNQRINTVLSAFDLPEIGRKKVAKEFPLKDIADQYGTIPDEIYPCQ